MGKRVRVPSAIKSKVTQQTRLRAGLHSGLQLEAESPAPSSPGQDGTREASPLADAAHAHSAGPGALHHGAHRTAAVVWCHGRPTPATSGAARHCGQSAWAALAGGTGGQRAHAPSPVPAFLAAALALIHPIAIRLASAGRLPGTSQGTSRYPLCPRPLTRGVLRVS